MPQTSLHLDWQQDCHKNTPPVSKNGKLHLKKIGSKSCAKPKPGCFAKRRSVSLWGVSLTAGSRRPQFRAGRPNWPQFSDLVTFVKWKITILGGWKRGGCEFIEKICKADNWRRTFALRVNEERRETRPKTKVGSIALLAIVLKNELRELKRCVIVWIPHLTFNPPHILLIFRLVCVGFRCKFLITWRKKNIWISCTYMSKTLTFCLGLLLRDINCHGATVS